MARKQKNQQDSNTLQDNLLGHWQLSSNLSEIPDKAFGFIYLIQNISNGKAYIGCKMMEKTIKRKPLKGKKKNRISKSESNWKEYTGSSTELNKDIEQLGKEQFKFTILQFCFSKSELKFIELMYQLINNVMFDEKYYNSMINVRLSKIKNFKIIEDFTQFKLNLNNF